MIDRTRIAEAKAALPAGHRGRGRLARIDDVLVGDFMPDRRSRRYGSLFFLIVAVILGAATYTVERFGPDKTMSLMPDMLSIGLAIFLIVPLYLRRILPWPVSVFLIVSGVFNLLVTAIVVNAVLGEASPLFGKLPMTYVLGAALAMTWLGMRPLAPLAWGLVLVLGFANVGAASDAMGWAGGAFIICAALGILLQSDFDPHSFGHEVRADFIGSPAAHDALQGSRS